MKPYSKFVNFKNPVIVGTPERASALPEVKKEAVHEKVAKVLANLCGNKEADNKQEPEFNVCLPQTEEAEVPMAVSQALADDQEELLADVEPSCLNDIFWDMKIDENNHSLHKW